MKRLYDEIARHHLKKYRQMLFLVGPRQVGKTTTGLGLSDEFEQFYYLNWDVPRDRALLTGDYEALESHLKLDRVGQRDALVVLDEIHKRPKWKDFLKGFFDAYHEKIKIVVTGSARLDILKHMGDSLMGRYFVHRVHPITIAELLDPSLRSEIIRPPAPVGREKLRRLFTLGGFPEPYLTNETEFSLQWQKLRFSQLFRGDLREITQIRELSQIELLGEMLRHQAGQLCKYETLAAKAQVSAPTIKKWIELLKAFFYCFTLSPFSRNIPRSLLKEPKIYLCDWSQVLDKGARIENFVACHLLKAVQHWNDRGMGQFGLHFVRDKDKREVDFLITQEDKPWCLIEVRASQNSGISKALRHFHKEIQPEHSLQLVFDADYVEADCFAQKGPIIAPVSTFLSQLV